MGPLALGRSQIAVLSIVRGAPADNHTIIVDITRGSPNRVPGIEILKIPTGRTHITVFLIVAVDVPSRDDALAVDVNSIREISGHYT